MAHCWLCRSLVSTGRAIVATFFLPLRSYLRENGGSNRRRGLLLCAMLAVGAIGMSILPMQERVRRGEANC